MKLTTKGRYALRAVLEIALRPTSNPISLTEISIRQQISQSYLEQLFSKLRKKGLVKSVRGPGGGYLLNHPLDQITVAQVLDAIEEDTVDPTKFCRENICKRRTGHCLVQPLWMELNKVIYHFLNDVTLDKIIKGSLNKTESLLEK